MELLILIVGIEYFNISIEVVDDNLTRIHVSYSYGQLKESQ